MTQRDSREYDIIVHNVGGKEPDGKPTRLGRWTFQTKIVRDVILEHLSGTVLNACAGKTQLEKRGCTIIRNDLNEDIPADSHYDVCTLDEHYEPESFDTVILDPPFDPGRGEKLYEGMHASGYIEAREAVAPLLKPGGTYIELGWNSWGLSGKDSFERVVEHQYRQPFKGDVHLLVERKINQTTLSESSV